MNKKVIISADSTCDLSAELLKKHNILTTPLHIILGEATYEDLVNITPDDIYAHFEKTGQLPKTAAVNMQEYIDKFKPYVDEGYEIVHLNIGGALSTSHQQCKLAARELGNVYPVDSCNITTGTGLLVLEAVEMAEKGLSGAEIVENIKKLVPKAHSSFIVDKLTYLHAGGRCSAVALLGSNLLKIKPCIEVNNADGSMNVGKKYRGNLKKVLEQYVNDKLSAYDNISKKRVFITHAGIPQETVDTLYNMVKERNYFDEVLITRASCTISSHCGPDTMGLIFMTE
ncbi:MAG: DegV family protein [Acutalibacteraceae bacterium]|nr:DegV family protein [Acutalibacteraceae bacterium]